MEFLLIKKIILNPFEIIFLLGMAIGVGVGITGLMKEIKNFRVHKVLRNDPFHVLLFFLILTLSTVGFIYRIRFYHTLDTLARIESSQVTMFRIYPRSSGPDPKITPIRFFPPDLMIDEFLDIAKHFQAYWLSPGVFISWDYEWYLEIIAGDNMVKVLCSLEPERDNTVLGEIGTLKRTGRSAYHGRFQSRQLYQ
jgi:hypothetical protein